MTPWSPPWDTDEDVTADFTTTEWRADSLSLLAFFGPIFIPVVLYYGFKLRRQGSQIAQKVLGRGIGALFFHTFLIYTIWGP
jgi:hypothetical protein